MRKGDDVATSQVCITESPLDQATSVIQRSRIVIKSKRVGTRKQDLCNVWCGFSGACPENRPIKGRVAPVEKNKANFFQRLLNNLPARCISSRTVFLRGEKDHA